VRRNTETWNAIFTQCRKYPDRVNRLALDAVATAARKQGFFPYLVDEPLSGDTTDAATRFADALRKLLLTITQLRVLAGGETTIHVTGAGKGGRNQDCDGDADARGVGERRLVVAGAARLVSIPTDAAGAFVDGQSVQRAARKGLVARTALKDNNSYSFFAALGDLFCPGQTGTNVMDIKLALLWP
jgi:glycerate-2-kinase